ncbi:MAG: preprotein translocase subunit SecE [Pseudanabaenaceae cyanobacterium]
MTNSDPKTTTPPAKPEGGLVKFFKETKQELDKVVWPSRQQLISESAAVLLMVVASASLIYLIDSLFAWIAERIF